MLGHITASKAARWASKDGIPGLAGNILLQVSKNRLRKYTASSLRRTSEGSLKLYLPREKNDDIHAQSACIPEGKK